MYKRSEPIKWLHSVQNHMANVYSSEVCLQTKNVPKISKFFFFFKNTPKYDKLSKISNISIKTILELWTKFGNFGNFGHISDRLRTIHNTCSNLIGSEPLYIPCIEEVCAQIAKFGNDFKKFTKLSPCFCVSPYVFISIVQNLFFSLKIFDEKKCNSDDSCQMEKNFVS